MVRDASRVLVTSLSILAVALAGCAKRPGFSQASAPAPAGTTVSAVPRSVPSPRLASAAERGEGSSLTGPMSGSALRGAAQAPRPAPKEFEANPNLRTIHFDFDRSDIRAADAPILEAAARWLNANPRQLLLIEGHCDERGTGEYNLALGERRAQATKNYLLSRGVQASRITLLSYGEERPVCRTHDEACWSRNRRAQFLTKSE